MRLPIPKLTNALLKYWRKTACQLTPNAYTYLSILEELVSSKFTNLAVKNVVQCFIKKPTTRKYFSPNKNGFLGAFCGLLNKAKVYESVDVKEKLIAEGGLWVLGSCGYE